MKKYIPQDSKCPSCKKNLEDHQTSQLVQCAVDELVKSKTKKESPEQQSQIQHSSETSSQGGHID